MAIGRGLSARSRVLGTLSNMTDFATLYDFRRLQPYEDELVAKFLSNVEIKRALKARESIVFDVCSDLVGKVLHGRNEKCEKWETLTHVVVMNAGHLVPTDQAVNSQAMIEDWVLENGLFSTGQIRKANDIGVL
ncbi:hypothetical protein HAX54_039609 [Datura stramonium]|uniref:Uncharacterized protein n=1 Tax=Datura stramonium TaxID=4076 RepID=A0ABS8VPG8_DATST|nr:hypothetical protein [Datura stramonium]